MGTGGKMNDRDKLIIDSQITFKDMKEKIKKNFLGHEQAENERPKKATFEKMLADKAWFAHQVVADEEIYLSDMGWAYVVQGERFTIFSIYSSTCTRFYKKWRNKGNPDIWYYLVDYIALDRLESNQKENDLYFIENFRHLNQSYYLNKKPVYNLNDGTFFDECSDCKSELIIKAYEKLTPRQKQAADCMLWCKELGKTQKDAAEYLNIAPQTFNKLLKTVRSKFEKELPYSFFTNKESTN